jgi:hypothetical protein
MITQTNESLRSVTLQVIDNYRKAAKYTTQALLATSMRGFRMVDAALIDYDGKVGEAVKGSFDITKEKIIAATDIADEVIGKLGSSAKSRLATTQEAIVNAADKADTRVNNLFEDASMRVARFPSRNGAFSGFLKSNSAKSVETISIPGAKILRFVSGRLADGAERLSLQLVGTAKKPASVRGTASKTRARKASIISTKAKVTTSRAKPKAKAISAAV